MRRQNGFTLIEVMIVVVIIGLLTMVALPSYTDYVRRGRIPDATSALSAKRVQMEQFYQDNRTYTGAPAAANDTTTSQFFDFAGNIPNSGDSYTLTATGKGAMDGFSFSVTESNAKSSTVTGVDGWSSNTTCWVTKRGGQC